MPLLLRRRYWGGHLLLLAALVACAALSYWQFGVWSANRATEARNLTHARPVPLPRTLGPDAPLAGDDLGRPVTVTGTWMGDQTMYVSGRPRQVRAGGAASSAGRPGYWVVTPVRVAGAHGSALPVVRGWSPRPQAPPVSGAVRLIAWLQAGEGDSAPDPKPGDRIISAVRIPSMTGLVDADLYSAYAIAEHATPGLVRVPPDAVPQVSGTTSLRNLLYGFQWIVFGGFAVVVWWRWCRDELERAEDSAPIPPRLRSGP